MEEFQQFIGLILNSEELVSKGGLLLVSLIVFAETGLFFCFFLPGDYLLFTAGMFCGLGFLKFPVAFVIGCIMASAIAGNFTGFFFGKFLGNKLLNRKDGLFFKRQYLINTEKAFQRYGGNALVIGRFLPVIRTFAPIIAGIVNMDRKKFMFYNVVGCIAWAVSMLFAGHYLYKFFLSQFNFDLKEHLEVIVLGIVLVTTLPVILKLVRGGKKQDPSNEA